MNDEAVQTDAAPAEAGQPRLPHLYQGLTSVGLSRHEKLCLRAKRDFGYARDSHALPLTCDEFRAAARAYPIVFADIEVPMPVAVVGVGDKRNLFVDAQGGWDQTAHVPLYVQRYPFLLAPHPDGKQTVLLIDDQSDMIEPGGLEAGGLPLFEEGAPSDLAKRAMTLCRSYAEQEARSRAFVTELRERDLLVDKVMSFRLPNGNNRRVTGIQVIDLERVRALPDDVLADWCRRGAMALVDWHLLSLDNAADLQRRALS